MVRGVFGTSKLAITFWCTLCLKAEEHAQHARVPRLVRIYWLLRSISARR